MDYTINNHLYEEKSAGDPLTHTEWNNLVSDVNAANSNAGGGSSNVTVTDVTIPNDDATANVAVVSGIQDIGSPNVIQLTKKKKGVNTTLVSGNNINIEPRESVDATKGGNISFKPGDDIEFCSHHRLSENQDEVSVKVIDGDDLPVKLQLNASEMVLTTKINKNTAGGDMNITVNNQTDTRGYLKVRAQAIDLRSESHGGIALQPKGYDDDGNMNKIKFEHGGGDGLEFGTFNTQHTSIYTGDYRFKKDGIIRLAERFTEVSDKADANDSTTAYKYLKNDSTNNAAKEAATGKMYEQPDDFYDFIDTTDPTCTWEDIVKFIAWAKANKSGKDWASIWPDPQA